MKYSKGGKFSLEGKHDVDKKWAEDVKSPSGCEDSSHSVKVVPRFSFDGTLLARVFSLV